MASSLISPKTKLLKSSYCQHLSHQTYSFYIAKLDAIYCILNCNRWLFKKEAFSLYTLKKTNNACHLQLPLPQPLPHAVKTGKVKSSY